MQHIYSLVRKCIDTCHMINPGDRLAVGVSGGKDSLLTLAALAGLRRFYPIPFELEAITLDMGFPDADFSEIRRFCGGLGVSFTLIPTQIAKIVFEIRRETHPCSLCAKLRRGILHSSALDLGCKKVALGHHFDDAVETFFLSLLFEGRISGFKPVTYLDRRDITLIRPMLLVEESDIMRYAPKLPVMRNPCPANGNTKRQEVKELLKTLEKTYPDLRKFAFRAYYPIFR